MLRNADGTKVCQKKLSAETDEHRGLIPCWEPVHFVGSERAAQEGTYSGWYHDDPELDLSHFALWDEAL